MIISAIHQGTRWHPGRMMSIGANLVLLCVFGLQTEMKSVAD
jgi:hypothetical protein